MRSLIRSWSAAAAVAVTLGAGVSPPATVLQAHAAGPAACVATGSMQFNPPLNTTIGTAYAFTFNGNASPCAGVPAGSFSGQGGCPSGGVGGAGGGTVVTCLSVLNGGAVVEGGSFSIVSPVGACSNGTWLQIGTLFLAECSVDGLGVLTFTGVFVPNPLFQAPIATVSFDGVLAATL